MDILLDNTLGTMYGPYFLIFYGFVILLTIVSFAYAKNRLDRTDELSIPPIPHEIDPYEIAFLRGGEHETARAVVFSLIQKNLAEIQIDGKTAAVKRLNNQTPVFALPPIEQTALSWLGATRTTEEAFQPNGLSGRLSSYAQTYQARLENGQMLVGEEIKNRLRKMKWTAAAAIFLLGAYKIIVAFAHDNLNITGIVILGAVGICIILASGNPPRVTKLGKAFLERLQLAFESLKYRAQAPYIAGQNVQKSPVQTISTIDPLLVSVGVFGSGILVGTVFDNYNEAFRRAQQQSSASSCGSGCGSSCSSGDGGGGGCGGCGGGD